MGFLDSLKKALTNVREDNDYEYTYDEDYYGEDEEEEEETPRKTAKHTETRRADERPAPKTRSSYDNVTILPISSNNQTPHEIIIAPVSSIDECHSIVECLRMDKVCIIDLKKIRKDDFMAGQRVVDYLYGATDAMNAKFDRIQNDIFVVAPESANISQLNKAVEKFKSTDSGSMFSFSWMKK